MRRRKHGRITQMLLPCIYSTTNNIMVSWWSFFANATNAGKICIFCMVGILWGTIDDGSRLCRLRVHFRFNKCIILHVAAYPATSRQIPAVATNVTNYCTIFCSVLHHCSVRMQVAPMAISRQRTSMLRKTIIKVFATRIDADVIPRAKQKSQKRLDLNQGTL
jgi:hypothetical protein